MASRKRTRSARGDLSDTEEDKKLEVEGPEKRAEKRRNRRLHDFRDKDFSVTGGMTLVAWANDVYGPQADKDNWTDEEKVENFRLYLTPPARNLLDPHWDKLKNLGWTVFKQSANEAMHGTGFSFTVFSELVRMATSSPAL